MTQPTFVFFLTLTDGTHGFSIPNFWGLEPYFASEKRITEDCFRVRFIPSRQACLTVRGMAEVLLC